MPRSRDGRRVWQVPRNLGFWLDLEVLEHPWSERCTPSAFRPSPTSTLSCSKEQGPSAPRATPRHKTCRKRGWRTKCRFYVR
eukprot:6186336-Prymnesium_polylepis.1